MVKKYISAFRKEFRKQSGVAIIAAFAFLIALTWRDFISEAVNHFIMLMNLQGPLFMYKFITALIVSIVAVLGILLAAKFHLVDQSR